MIFFHLLKVVKQGDPLSLILFIISAEVLSRSLNKLNQIADFVRFGLPRWSEKFNHLSNADDTILFYSTNKKSVKMIKQVLREYEKVSGQMVNLSKSFIYLHENTSVAVGIRIRRWIGIGQGQFPFNYLGCPIFYGWKKKKYFKGLIRKTTGKIFSWKSKLLTPGGKYTLIRHVLQSIPIYQMLAFNPPKVVINLIHKIIAKFFLGDFGQTSWKH